MAGWIDRLDPRLAAGRGDKRAAEEGAVAEALGYDVLDADDVAYDPELGYERAVQTPARGPRRHRHVTY